MRQWTVPIVGAGIVALLGSALPACGATLASDDASQSAYDDGWDAGDNGGSGFLPWSVVARENDSGFGGGFISSNNGAVDIGTGPDNKAFGVYGNGGGVGQAIRPFDGALSVGQTFLISMDNQGIDNGGTVGFGLQTSDGTNRLEFYFVGGESTYTVNNGDVISSDVGWTEGGLNLAITLTGPDSFSLTINGGEPIIGALGGPSGSGISQVRLFNANGGPDVFFNNLAIVPEPASVALLGLGAMVGLLRRRG